MPIVTWRAMDPRLAPRRTKLPVPGWGGADVPRADGQHEQPWHCIPFTEAATSGIEVLFPYDVEVHVTGEADGPRLDLVGTPGGDPPPMRPFGEPYYTWQCLLDLNVTEEFAIKVETHPRFYTDPTGTVPIAVPAIIRPWWPMIYFAVFKTPLPGQTHVFRPGEPVMQLSLIPVDKIELKPMEENEAAEREVRAERIYASRTTLGADSQWTSSTDTVFDGTYRRLYGAARSPKR